jgi:mannose-6-phosphate isomerase-like protein (cupin superfamily)
MIHTENSVAAATFLDAPTLVGGSGARGVCWGGASDDLNVTLVSWPEGSGGVAAHVNRELDVVLVVVEGAGEVTVDSQSFALSAGQALLLPKGCERAIRSTSAHFDYLSIHRRRPGVQITVGAPARRDLPRDLLSGKDPDQ